MSSIRPNLEAEFQGLPQLQASVADVLDWAEEGYDVVQAALGIFFFPDLQAGTERLISRARSGGRVGFTIWRSGAMEAPGRILGEAIASVTGTPAARRPTS